MHPSVKLTPWKEILPFQENENLFLVDISIEPELFLQVLSDDSQSYLQEWIRDGLVVCPLPDEIEAWNLNEDATFPTIQVGEMAFVLIEV
ncbi:MAG: hypothetical protein COW00_17540 [Bdellovibrio sp. CG12_big_fil_rev_8_21_14_0_65_39_13]|nr:MAG: hypothetical protein COW78_06665 [Bdellovibrio sp. CG22_combo_CG10-13_8_21_14_all_39_27]PIQ58081.1 MAG: hypothetical protein COW00_17540 [Bdellovibrio sp. CG12_big_fil_rev_8_21_14_0_65_39_13]PIR32956.1 MAG: hypothetical protein COV37_17835 [Bdellovibrio sp. CG11_big_fil_rev_8_21_14_0_20_39_38]PJB54486.1 MAG: hypothetical protein CO099_01325 [Bdellovibrio sp. CG_4_9_14_3_um_filter_39_7]